MSQEELEQKVQELQREIDNRNNNSRPKVGRFSRLVGLFSKLKKIFSKLNQKILDSNGFMTKEGKYLCKSEWHAAAMPIGFISSAFILEKLGVIVFATFFLMYRRGFKLAENPNYEGHWNDVIDESAYTAMAMLATIIYWTYYTPETIEGFEAFGGAIGRIFIGA